MEQLKLFKLTELSIATTECHVKEVTLGMVFRLLSCVCNELQICREQIVLSELNDILTHGNMKKTQIVACVVL